MTGISDIRNIGESVGNTVLENFGRVMGRAQERTPLPVDLLESDEAYLAVFDAPGATTQDVQVQYRDGTVEVRIDRFRGFHEGFEMRYPGRGLSLDGRVELPSDASVDPAAARARLRENGTLEVRVPKVADEADGGRDAVGEADEWEPKSGEREDDDEDADETEE